MRNGDLTRLVATLFGIGYLIFDLDRASACFNHTLGEQVRGLLVSKAGVDIRNNGHNV